MTGLFFHTMCFCFLAFGIVTPGEKEQRVCRAVFFSFQRNAWQWEVPLLRCKVVTKPCIVVGLQSRRRRPGTGLTSPGMCLGSSERPPPVRVKLAAVTLLRLSHQAAALETRRAKKWCCGENGWLSS